MTQEENEKGDQNRTEETKTLVPHGSSHPTILFQMASGCFVSRHRSRQGARRPIGWIVLPGKQRVRKAVQRACSWPRRAACPFAPVCARLLLCCSAACSRTLAARPAMCGKLRVFLEDLPNASRSRIMQGGRGSRCRPPSKAGSLLLPFLHLLSFAGPFKERCPFSSRAASWHGCSLLCLSFLFSA